jgi:5'-nucleotidase
MEPGEPREARESGPGAETAAVPRWEEAKAFHDNLTPKKKPKSVKKKQKTKN